MSIVADYESSSASEDDKKPDERKENEEGRSRTPRPTSRSVAYNTSSKLENPSLSGAKGKRKRKKRSITTAILPADVQAALMKAQMGVMSDDEDEDVVSRQALNGVQDPESALLHALPKPQFEVPPSELQPDHMKKENSTASSSFEKSGSRYHRMQTKTDYLWKDLNPADEERIVDSSQRWASSSQERLPAGADDEVMKCNDNPIYTDSTLPIPFKRHRRRDRDLERELESGNLDAVSQAGAVHVNAPSGEWKPPTKADDHPLESQVYNPETGDYTTILRPTLNMRRKHQINEVAFKAAEKEQELLEAKGRYLKTKAQTQAKYGW